MTQATATEIQDVRPASIVGVGAGVPSARRSKGRFGEALAERSSGRNAEVSLGERAVALLLLILALPLLAVMALGVLVLDGRPVLYRGQRLGLRKRQFTIYKIRTLRREAQVATSERLLRPTDGLEIPGGHFLRDTRLDELPQLWNVVRGDMRFVGPRPEREAVYKKLCREIQGYAKRFDVRPGILGPSQIFTPHSTPKRVRAWLDGCWARRNEGFSDLAGLSACTVMAMARKVLQRSRAFAADDLLRCGLGRRYRSRRRLRRVRVRGALAHVAPLGASFPQVTTRLLDMNEETLRLLAAPGWKPGDQLHVSLQLPFDPRNGTGRAARSAECRATVLAARGDDLLLGYAPENPRSEYLLHQYFLGEALAPPRGRRRRPASIAERSKRLQPVEERPVPAGSWS
jgi:lipopolysaccharide/colanic/teichoic acid biosynthesis glycosyltransferase